MTLNKTIYWALLTIIFSSLFIKNAFPQCCAGGSGSPIAGGSSQGVLQENQIEINSNFQYINTQKFLYEDFDTAKFLENFNSSYLYTRLAYGFTKEFTMSVESGYWLYKTEISMEGVDTFASAGIGDLILFPRYDVFNRSSGGKKTELTIGVGFKIPLGKYNDSLRKIEPFSGDTFFLIKPLAVQTSSGSNDIIFYTFFFRGYPANNLRFFANALYIKKGWNPVGEKIGDYASIGLFAGKTFFKKLGVTLQLKGEWLDQMKLNPDILLYAYPSYNPEATGSRKLFFVPQISYSYKSLTFYALSDIPVYQYVTQAQVASQYQFTFGISYRFELGKSEKENVDVKEEAK